MSDSIAALGITTASSESGEVLAGPEKLTQSHAESDITSIDGSVEAADQLESVPVVQNQLNNGTINANNNGRLAPEPEKIQSTESGRMPRATAVDEKVIDENTSINGVLSEPVRSEAEKNAARLYASAVVQNVRGTAKKVPVGTEIESIPDSADHSGVKEMTELSNKVTVAAEKSAESGDSSDDKGSRPEDKQTGSNGTFSTLLMGETAKLPTHTSVSADDTVVEQPARTVAEQVVEQVRERLTPHELKEGIQHITLILSPENLGELKMNLNLQGQKLSVEIVTGNQTVRDAIAQHTDALKESLSRQNITMTSFDVSTGGGKGSGNQGTNQNAWREMAKQQQQQQFWKSNRDYRVAEADVPAAGSGYQRLRDNGMLDIHY